MTNSDGSKKSPGSTALLCGNDLTKTTPSEPTEVTTNTPTVAPTADTRPVLIIDGVAVAITSYELKNGIYTAFADELPHNGVFIVLKVTLTNRRDIANQNAPLKNLLIIDSGNAEYSIDNYASVLANDSVGQPGSFSNISLEPGVQHEVFLVYDVPVQGISYRITDAGRTFLVPISEP